MNIVSVVREAFQEYEDEISLALCCSGCPFKCPNCHMRDLIYDPNKVIGLAKDLFYRHVNPMHTAVVLSGGEPTLWNRDMVKLMVFIRSFNLKIKVFSNGFLPGVIKEWNLLKLVDMYSFDVKAIHNVSQVIGVPEISDKEYLLNLTESLYNCQVNKVPFELRHTMSPGTNVEEVKAFVQPYLERGIKIHYQKHINL